MFGSVQEPAYKLWFDVIINATGERIEFGFQEKTFSTKVEDYFLLSGTECSFSLICGKCGGMVVRVRDDVKKLALPPPSWDNRDIVHLLDMAGEGQVCDWGWRDVEFEEPDFM